MGAGFPPHPHVRFFNTGSPCSGLKSLIQLLFSFSLMTIIFPSSPLSSEESQIVSLPGPLRSGTQQSSTVAVDEMCVFSLPEGGQEEPVYAHCSLGLFRACRLSPGLTWMFLHSPAKSWCTRFVGGLPVTQTRCDRAWL